MFDLLLSEVIFLIDAEHDCGVAGEMFDEIAGDIHAGTGAMAVDELFLLVFGLFYFLVGFGVLKDLYFVVNLEVESDFLVCGSLLEVVGDDVEVVLE